MKATATSALVAAPVVRLTIDGSPLSAAVTRSVTTVVVAQRLGRPAQLQLTVHHQEDDALIQLISDDTSIVARVDGHDVDLFAGRITGVRRSWTTDGQEQITVRADDALERLRTARRSTAFSDMSPIEIASQIVQGHGLRCQSNRTAPTVASVHQVAETDLAFIRRLLAPLGLTPTLRGETMHLVPAEGIGATVRLSAGEQLHQLSIDQRTTSPTEAGVIGWNSSDAEPVTAGAADVSGGWSLDVTLAGQLAEAATEWRRLDQVVATGIATGDSLLRPGTPIELRTRTANGPGTALTDPDTLTVTSCTHRIDAARGHVTEFSTEPIDPCPAPSPLTLTLGQVVDVDDPERRARVKVALSALGDLATEWVPVLCPGAGPDIGIVALPDVGARVAILGPSDTPGSGVVLGGLFGRDTAPGPPIVGGRSRTFAARLPGGGQLIMADDDSRILVDNGAGSRLELTPDAVTLHAAADLEIAAPGRRLVIRADTIDFERG